MTDAEWRLWQHLRMLQMNGHRFRRQHPLGPYIVDFACLDAQLIIELDGSQHLDSATDARRHAWCVQRGYRVLGFWNHDVLQRTESVLEAIHQALDGCPHPALRARPTAASPARGGGG